MGLHFAPSPRIPPTGRKPLEREPFMLRASSHVVFLAGRALGSKYLLDYA
jgi:hypothetical protein